MYPAPPQYGPAASGPQGLPQQSGVTGYPPPGSAALPPPAPGSRPPLPRRRPQEHLAAPLTQTSSSPVDRVGEGLTPNLMADFRRGLALGATETHSGNERHTGNERHSSSDPHGAIEPLGGQPHEPPPNQEGRR